jgi:CheY-like chemotaxis protein
MTARHIRASAQPIGKRPQTIQASDRPNTLGIAQRELDLLLGEMDNVESPASQYKREFARWPFRHSTVQFEVTHPGGTVTKLKLACRNLSRGGIGLLHNGFVHPGSPCRVWLPRLVGGSQEMPGVVTRCSHRRGALHEIGVKFAKPADLRSFIGGSRNNDFYTLEKVVPDKLVGRVLYIEDCTIDIRIIQHFLRSTQIRLKICETAATGLIEAAQGFDLILCDWRLPDMPGTQLMAQARMRGIQTPALIVTADPVSLIKDGLYDIPDVGVLAKPITQDQLLRMLAERLIVGRDDDSMAKMAVDKGLSERLASEMSSLIDKLDSAVQGGDSKTCYEVAMQIKGVAPLMGLSETVRVTAEVTDEYTTKGGRIPCSRFAQICAVARRSV